jgi:hypothetical protein
MMQCDMDRAAFYSRLSLRERVKKRYFRGAKDDTNFPLGPKPVSDGFEGSRSIASSFIECCNDFLDLCFAEVMPRFVEHFREVLEASETGGVADITGG